MTADTLTPALHAELLRAEERLKWLNEQDFMLQTIDQNRVRYKVIYVGGRRWAGPTVAAVIDLAMQATEAGGAKGTEASGGR